MRPYLEKPFTKIGQVEWLKVEALSSSPSTAKRKRKEGRRERERESQNSQIRNKKMHRLVA
jgi:hypothetical protein